MGADHFGVPRGDGVLEALPVDQGLANVLAFGGGVVLVHPGVDAGGPAGVRSGLRVFGLDVFDDFGDRTVHVVEDAEVHEGG